MAGIYIHIPFCRTRCIYCDFFTQTDQEEKSSYVESVCKELELRKDYLNGEPIKTIYFGGGTPSQLNQSDFESIFTTIQSNYQIVENREITLEANPDDLTDEYTKMLSNLPFNRISVGIQSFDNTELKFLNRRHSAEKAIESIEYCQKNGFDNISIDLMYGLPDQTLETWHSNLKKAISLNVQHISAYHLIYEEGTKLYRLLEDNKVKSTEEELSVEMFSVMKSELEKAGFIHYEISNFSKKGFISKHNSSYWSGEKYLGIGASAHSYNEESRGWNVASMSEYIEGIKIGAPSIKSEALSQSTRYNDYILTRMRTMWGADIEEIETMFGKKLLNYCLENARKHLKNENIRITDNHLIISRKGLLISDGIMSDLMYID